MGYQIEHFLIILWGLKMDLKEGDPMGRYHGGPAECAELPVDFKVVKIKREFSSGSSARQLPCKQGAGGL